MHSIEEAATLQSLKGVGPATLTYLASLEIHTISDLLFHLPIRYEDRTRVTPIAQLRVGDRVMIAGTIVESQWILGRQRSLLIALSDPSAGRIKLRFFHSTVAQRQQLMVKGQRLSCFGEVRTHYAGGFEMVHPEYRLLAAEAPIAMSDRLTAIYPTTKGLGQAVLRKLIAAAFGRLGAKNSLDPVLPPLLSAAISKNEVPGDNNNFLSLYDALYYVHYPPPDARLSQLVQGKHPAQQRLVFEELLAHHLALRARRTQVQAHRAPVLPLSSYLFDKIVVSLPFRLTAAQTRVLVDIHNDLAKPQAMLRLVQGDVGSGKTIVAALAVAQAVEAGYQVAVMAPTEILAEQHYQKFCQWFLPLGIDVGWLSGQLSAVKRRPVLATLAQGDLAIVIGTHALFQQEVAFKKLALVVIDEQHRFGVGQRLLLKEKGILSGQQPHQLIMTATPIPRTLAMTAYADLDCSIIDALPPGRLPITTVAVSNQRRDMVIARVLANGKKGFQAYWVCTLIEESELLQCQAAAVTAEHLQQVLTPLTVALIHGRMKPEEKEQIMAQFKEGKIAVLVATTVVEVGVDVANANLMVIENPERLGLSQLHQLRGRVGRSDIPSHCVLLYQAPLPDMAQRRLTIMRDTHDGFKIAEEDLAMRGPGEFLGTKQAGMLSFRIADVVRDQQLLPMVKEVGVELQNNHPEYVAQLIARWVGTRKRYFEV